MLFALEQILTKSFEGAGGPNEHEKSVVTISVRSISAQKWGLQCISLLTDIGKYTALS